VCVCVFVSALAATSSERQVRVEHVQYVDTVKDPVGTVKRLYAQFGWEYTAAFDEKLNAYLDKNTRERAAKAKAAKEHGSGGNQTGHAAHTYSLEEYGLDEAEMKERLSWYYSTYLKK
jgi:KaiC/GvpD/RAD55 family RecA-like ATPase